MARYERVKGLRVVTLAEGKEIGKVDEVILRAEQKRVGWFRLHVHGMFGERRWIRAEAVHALGEDVMLIKSEADVLTEADAEIQAQPHVPGTRVVTEDGHELGTASNYEFSASTFEMESMLVSPGMSLVRHGMTIPRAQVLKIGADVIVVSTEVLSQAEEISETPEEQEKAHRDAPLVQPS